MGMPWVKILNMARWAGEKGSESANAEGVQSPRDATHPVRAVH